MTSRPPNRTLTRGRVNRNDEFYTRQEDIEKEMKYYKSQFKDKVVFCNCDDPAWSDFWQYFVLFFDNLKLKKLIATHYRKGEQTYKLEYHGKGKGPEKKTPLRPEGIWTGDGDFRSPECIEILKEADIIVTNPPFSLFRKYVEQLMEYKKKFLIIGNLNSITCKELIPYIINNKIWFGCTPEKGDLVFRVPEYYEAESDRLKVDGKTGQKYMSHGNALWITNLPHKKREKEFLDLSRHYDEAEYPAYDNYPHAIEVKFYKKIPRDYDGEMGVPITFLKQYNPNQFDLLGADWQMLEAQAKDSNKKKKGGTHRFILNGETKYARVIIKHKKKGKENENENEY